MGRHVKEVKMMSVYTWKGCMIRRVSQGLPDANDVIYLITGYTVI